MATANNDIIYDDDPFGKSDVIYDDDPFRDDSIIYDDDPFTPLGSTKASDYAISLARGTSSTAQMAALAGQALLSSPGSPLGPVSKTVGDFLSDPRGYGRSETSREIGQAIKYPVAKAIPPLREINRELEESYSPRMKAERAKPFLRKAEEGETAIAGYRPGPGMASGPKVLSMVVESIPMTVAGMGAGAGIAKGLMAVPKLGLSKGLAGAIGFGIGEGVTAGGTNGLETYYQVIETPDEKLEKSRVFKHALKSQPKDLPLEQRRAAAKRTLALASATMVGVATGISTGILGAPSGYVAGKLLAGETAGPLWQSILYEALSEGIIEEMPQSAVEQTIQNLVTKTVSDPDQPILEGVGEAAIGGLLTGVAMGGGMGVGFGLAGAKAKRQAKQPDQPIDVTEGIPDKEQDAFITQVKQDFGTGDLAVPDLQEIATRFPKGSKVVREINNLIKQDAALREPEIQLLNRATPGEILEADRQKDRETGMYRDTPGIPMPGVYPPLAHVPAQRSAIPLQQDAYWPQGQVQFERQQDLAEEGLQSEQIAQEEGLEREMLHREASMPDAGVRLGERLQEVEAEEAIRGLGGMAGYVTDLLNQVKAGRPGGRVQIKDAVGAGEEWIGFSSTYPEFMSGKHSSKQVIKALERGLSGRPFKPNETRLKAIWEDTLEAAGEIATRDAIQYAKLVEAEPETIGGLEEQDFVKLLEVLNAEGYSTRAVEEAAARFRAPIHSRALEAAASELGISEEEINALINDPNQPIDIDDVWSEATSQDYAEFEAAQEEIDRDRETREGVVRGLGETGQEGEPEEPGGAIPEPRRGGEEAEPGGVLQEEGGVQVDEEAKSKALAAEFNEKHPGNDLKYDGTYEYGVDLPTIYQFTPQTGIIRRATFTIKELTFDAVLAAFNEKYKAFVKPGEMLLRDKDGVIYRDKGPTHVNTMDAFNLDPDDIEAVGIVDKDGDLIWQEPRPKQLEKPEEYKKAAAEQKAKEKPERRKDLARRKRIAEMSPEEMRKELTVDELTGVGSLRAYEDSEKKAFHMLVDIDSLKWVNDNMGHESGDHLLVAVAQAFKTAGAEIYRTGGDEFIVQADTEDELLRHVDDTVSILNDATVEATTPEGDTLTYQGLEFSAGIGKTRRETDERLRESKEKREETGLRAARGERPPGMAEKPAPGKQAEIGKKARETWETITAKIETYNSLLECME